MNTTLLILNILGGLAIFLYGMKLMSDALQKMAGNAMRRIVVTATSNRFLAAISGFAATSITQSSSATTLMVVSLASAGVFTLHQALGIIFGINIGTTTTAWLISIFGFKIPSVLFALPAVAVGFFMQFSRMRKTQQRVGEALLGFGLLFFGLEVMKHAIPAAASSPDTAIFFTMFNTSGILPLIFVITCATLLTMFLQNPGAVMVISIVCAAKGYIDFPTAAAFVLGENIGTTITANLAAIGATSTARRAGLGHFLFNFIGLCWVLILFKPFTHFIEYILPLGSVMPSEALMAFRVSAFHTIFNIINTVVLLVFINRIAAWTLYFIPNTEKEETGNELVFLTTRFANTPEIAVQAARKELERMISIAGRMLNKLTRAIRVKEDDVFERMLADALEAETATDILEHKINSYLSALANEQISPATLNEVLALMDIANSTERMADCGQKIANIIKEDHAKGEFSSLDKTKIENIALKTQEAIKDAKKSLLYFEGPGMAAAAKEFLKEAAENELALNTMRNIYREEHNMRLVKNNEFSPEKATHYADILSSLERMGDFALRIIENSLGRKVTEHEHVLQTLAEKK